MTPWLLQDFNVGDISCQLIEFSVEGHEYVMVFNRVEETRDQELIDKQAEHLGILYKENSFEVKFDLKANFENDTFFKPPSTRISVSGITKLGNTIKELLDFHYRNTEAEAYIFVAENEKLKRFYDRLADLYAEEIYFEVNYNLGDEGLCYEITTPRNKG